jgi:hypothetical protein
MTCDFDILHIEKFVCGYNHYADNWWAAGIINENEPFDHKNIKLKYVSAVIYIEEHFYRMFYDRVTGNVKTHPR